MPAWDNSARRKNGAFVIDGSTPEKFGTWFEKVCEKAEVFSEQENFVFINAWNEWAEGNHLEPDKKWGRAYLEQVRKVMKAYL
jgi:lipopolysaccharide biosynthesis protein